MVNDGNSNRPSDSNGSGVGSGPNDGNKGVLGRRPFIKAAGTGAVLTGLAGCLGGGGGGGSARKIGVMGPESLPQGQSIINSAELAVSEFETINGEEVELVTENTEATVSQTRSAYQNLTTGEQVDATVGVFRSEALMGAVFDLLPQSQTIHLGTGAATPEATSRVKDNYEDYKYFFRTGPTNAVFLGNTMVNFAARYFDSMGWDDVALFMEDFAWTQLVQRTLESNLEDAADVNIVTTERPAGGTEDYSTTFENIENAGADGAYTAISSGTSPIIQWANQQPNFQFGGINVPSQLPSLWNQTDGRCEYVFTQTSAIANAEITEKTVPYGNAYQDMFDSLPIYTGFHTYDAMYMYKEAVERAGTFETEEVIAELENASYTGTVGTVEFFGQDADFPHDIKPGEDLFEGVYFQWQDTDGGSQQPLWPDDVATAEYQTPDWI